MERSRAYDAVAPRSTGVTVEPRALGLGPRGSALDPFASNSRLLDQKLGTRPAP